MAGHELDVNRDLWYLQSLDASDAPAAAARNVSSYQDEFIDRKPFIFYRYDVLADGSFGLYGKSVREMSDNGEVGYDRVESLEKIARAMHDNPSIQEAYFHSPDVGYAREYGYRFTRDVNGGINAVAIEFQGSDDQRIRFREELFHKSIGVEGETFDRSGHLQPIYFNREIPLEEYTEIIGSVHHTTPNGQRNFEYLNRLRWATERVSELREEHNVHIDRLTKEFVAEIEKSPGLRQGLNALYQGIREITNAPETPFFDSKPLASHVVNLSLYVSRRVITDTRETFRQVSELFTDEQRRQFVKDRVLGLVGVRELRTLFGKKDMKEHRSEKTVDRLPLKKIKENPVGLVEGIEIRYTETQRSAVMIGLITETGIAVHALPVVLASLAEKLPVPIRAVEKSIKRHKKKEIRLKNHEVQKRNLDARSDVKKDQSSNLEHKGRKKRRKAYKEVSMSDSKHISKERKGLRKRKRKIGVGEKTVKKSAVVDSLTVLKLKNERQLRKRRLRRVAKTIKLTAEAKPLSISEKTLWRIATRFARRMEQKRKEMNRMPHTITKPENGKRIKKREITQRETVSRKFRKESKEATSNFSFAFIVWLLHTHFERHTQTHVAVKPFEGPKDDSLPISHEIHQNQEELNVKEPAPWILLSIIWYLAMVREGGLGKMPNAKFPMPNKKLDKKKRSKKKQFFHVSSIPKYAVIFAFNS